MVPVTVAKNGFPLERIAALCAVMDAGTIADTAGAGVVSLKWMAFRCSKKAHAQGVRTEHTRPATTG